MKTRFYILFIIAFLFSSYKCESQTYASLKIGAGGGWWLQENTSPNRNGSAWDRSHFNFNLPVDIGIEKQLFKRVRMGIFGFYSAVQDYELVKSTDQSYHRDRLDISEGWFSMLGGGISAQYDFLSSDNFSLSLAGQMGFFHLNTTHPDEQGFKNKFLYTIGPKVLFKREKIEYVLYPNYSEFQFNNSYNPNGKNRMYFLNFTLGISKRISIN